MDLDRACWNDRNYVEGREGEYMWLWTGNGTYMSFNTAVFYLLDLEMKVFF